MKKAILVSSNVKIPEEVKNKIDSLHIKLISLDNLITIGQEFLFDSDYKIILLYTKEEGDDFMFKSYLRDWFWIFDAYINSESELTLDSINRINNMLENISDIVAYKKIGYLIYTFYRLQLVNPLSL